MINAGIIAHLTHNMNRKKLILLGLIAAVIAAAICYIDHTIRTRNIKTYREKYEKLVFDYQKGTLSPDQKKEFQKVLKHLLDLRYFKYRNFTLKNVTIPSETAAIMLGELKNDSKLVNGLYKIHDSTEKDSARIEIWAKYDMYKKLCRQASFYDVNYKLFMPDKTKSPKPAETDKALKTESKPKAESKQ